MVRKKCPLYIREPTHYHAFLYRTSWLKKPRPQKEEPQENAQNVFNRFSMADIFRDLLEIQRKH